MGDDFEEKARAFHRAYQRRNAIAFGASGLVVLAGGIAVLLWALLADHTPNEYSMHSASYQEGQWIRLACYGAGGIVVGIVLLGKAILLARNLDRPVDPADGP